MQLIRILIAIWALRLLRWSLRAGRFFGDLGMWLHRF